MHQYCELYYNWTATPSSTALYIYNGKYSQFWNSLQLITQYTIKLYPPIHYFFFYSCTMFKLKTLTYYPYLHPYTSSVNGNKIFTISIRVLHAFDRYVYILYIWYKSIFTLKTPCETCILHDKLGDMEAEDASQTQNIQIVYI